jgi:hypothetical protein
MMAGQMSAAEIKLKFKVNAAALTSELFNLRLWASGMGAIFALSLGIFWGGKESLSQQSSSVKDAVFAIFVLLVLNILCLAASIALLETNLFTSQAVQIRDTEIQESKLRSEFEVAERIGTTAFVLELISVALTMAYFLLILFAIWSLLFDN